MLKYKSLKIYYLLIIFAATGCLKDITEVAEKADKIDEIIWNPHIAVPLVYSKIGIESLLGDAQNQFLYIRSDKSIEVGYTGNIFSKQAYEVFTFPDQSFDYNLTLSPAEVAALNLNDSIEVNRNFTFQLSFPGDFEVDSVVLNSGNISVNTSSTLRHHAVIEMGLPDLIKNGAPQNLNLDMNYSGQIPVNADQNIDLSQSKINLSNGAQNHSTMRLNTTFKLYKNSSEPVIGSENVSFIVALSDIKFKRLHFFSSSFDLRSDANEFEIGLFDRTSGQGDFSLADPRLKLILSNSFGIPVEYSLIKFDGTNTSGNTVSLSGSNIGTIENLPFPGNDYNNIYKDSFEINKSNTNIVDYLKNQPVKNEFDFSVETAPTTSQRYWMQDSSVVKFDAEVLVPLHGTVENVVFEQTQPIDFGIDDAEAIEELQLRIYTENGFPVGVNVQAFFIDSTTNQVFDSLFLDNTLFLKAADVDSDGRVTQYGKRLVDIKLDSDRVKKVTIANMVRFTVAINTTRDNQGQYKDVKFYSDYDILLQLGIQAKILIKQ
jgi:hypothetical protein